MSRRTRPTAFEVSFPEEAAANAAQSSGADSSRPQSNRSTVSVARERYGSSASRSSLTSSSKRKEHDDSSVGLTGKPKRRKTGTDLAHGTQKLSYKPDPKDIREQKGLFILGEDPEDEDDDSDDVPVRILSDFCIFDPKSYEVLSLSTLDEEHHSHNLEAAGCVVPVFANEEDAGQEDDGADEDDQGARRQDKPLQRLRTTSIFRYTIDYTKMDDPVYIQTEFGWYILKSPSSIYQRHFHEFYEPHRISQLLISAAKENPQWTYRDFARSYVGIWDPLLSSKVHQANIDAAIPLMSSVLHESDEADELMATPMLSELLRDAHPSNVRINLRHSVHPAPINRRPVPISRGALAGNIDLAVLRPENQNRTHVTPLIDRLALGLFQEHLEVVGAKEADKQDFKLIQRKGRAWLTKLLGVWMDRESKAPKVDFPRGARIRGDYWNKVVIDKVEYSVGDVILTPAGPDEERRRKRAELPTDFASVSETATFADYFWFGKIIYIDRARERIHCQWLEHASMTLLGEIGDPQELFLCGTCSAQPEDVDVRSILDKATVHWSIRDSSIIGPSDFHCRYLYSEWDASFVELDEDYFDTARGSAPGQNCPVCLIAQQREEDAQPRKIGNGVASLGVSYHVDDFVLLKADTDNGPANIAQIIEVHIGTKARSAESAKLTVRMLGRIGNIIDLCPDDIIKDERHLFMTDEEVQVVDLTRLIQRCTVLHPDSRRDDLTEWLSYSPYHFYVRYHFPTLHPRRWSEKTALKHTDILVCSTCYKEDSTRIADLQKFLTASRPLRAFDPFGGVGAFGLGLEESGCLKMVQAVEISPSAARTLHENSPDTIVHNQCSNLVLQYAIKNHAGHKPDVPTTLGNSSQKLPTPPRPGEIDCIVAGFPCQPHSRLNMFQRANDRKSHLILNLLSWIDFLQPKFCFLENVRGFMSYNLNATQAGRYRVEGGIDKGGLKFLVHVLLAMNYQVRFGLLQAAHYGTPQARVRFFLIAARRGFPLPSLPQPTHDFPLPDALKIKLSNEGVIKPVWTQNGIAPFKYVSIEDAISDLPRFHWKNPHKLVKPLHPARRQVNAEDAEDEDDDEEVPEIACDRSQAYCGLSGPNVRYHHKPQTTFQLKCRGKASRDLQHFTRVLKEETIERVVNIPLRAKADYKSLHSDMWEWQFANPSSAVARDGFRSGLYGRLDKDGWFQTTVTNVEPTAKQSWVLNPYCKRMVTVRELARSQGFPDHFIFHSDHDDIKTMHRQIGNAVPWPVAAALGRELREAALNKWLIDRKHAIDVD